MTTIIGIKNTKRIVTFCFTAWICGITFFSGSLAANPQNGVVVAGSATITNNANVTEIKQATDKAIINWGTFSIGSGEETRFHQPSSTSITLNRVTGNVPSHILGKLTANGQIMLLNSAGIIFGAGSKIDVAGLIATTAYISDQDFLAGNYRFTQNNDLATAIINNGEISVSDRGLVALVAPGVENNGIIRANLGRVALASGKNFTIDLYGDQLIHFDAGSEITKAPVDANGRVLKTAVANNGAIYADGGKVLLSAKVAENIVDNVISMGGIIQATTASVRNGIVTLLGEGGAVEVSGTINASGKSAGQKGGQVKILGKKTKLTSTAKIDVSGDSGGGEILVGGNYQGIGPEPNAQITWIDQGALLNASALMNGDGGRIIVWADDYTNYAGDIIAQGGAMSGDGGFAEVSGKAFLDFTGTADLSAPYGAVGELLLDPGDITISTGTHSVSSSGTPTNSFTGSNSAASILNTTTLINALTNANVTVQTGDVAGGGNGDIIVANSFNWSSANSLTLKAFRHVTLNTGSVITSSGGGAVNLVADFTGTGTGRITGAGTISAPGAQVKFFYNPTTTLVNGINVPDYANPIPYSSNVTNGTLTAYMLVNNVNNLQRMSVNLSGNYGLNKNIDASVFSSLNSGAIFDPIGDSGTPFTGKFDGRGYKISGLAINRATEDNVGLFGYLSGANIQNVGLTNAQITGASYVGALAGQITGGTTLTKTYSASGTVSGSGSHIGGLVGGTPGGINYTVTQSYTSGTVTSTGTGQSNIGGLIGWANAYNPGTGTISNSYSIATVNGGTSNNVGGLIGFNNNTSSVINSYSAGQVNGTGSANHGFIGNNNAAPITSSYWDEDTSGRTLSSGGTSKSTEEMMQQSTFSGWSFYDPISNPTGVWLMAGYLHLTMENTSIITNVVELQLMAANLAGNYTLANNIDASTTNTWNKTASIFAGFTPVGQSAAFTGTFNGGNYAINNLYINLPNNSNYTGLFGVANGTNVTLQNVSLTNANITGGINVGGVTGGLVGRLAGTGASISNVHVSGAVTGGNTVGGIAGFIVGPGSGNGAALNNSSNSAAVSSASGQVGGLFGNAAYKVNITNSYNTGTVSGSDQVGGLGGELDTIASITGSYNTGTINGTGDYIGGLIGLSYGVISNSYNTGTVNGSTGSNGVGGLVGIMASNFTTPVTAITTSYNSGTVTGATGIGIGGIVGETSSCTGVSCGINITNVYNSGAVIGVVGTTGADSVGGLIGVAGAGTIVTNTYNSGAVSGSTNVGGLIGRSSGATVNSSYWDTDTSGQQASPGGGAGRETSLMMQQGTFSGWSFFTQSATSNPWAMAGYPRLIALENTSTITNVVQLQLMNYNLAGTYTLANNIDASATSGWNNGAGFTPIGSATTPFTGSLNGANYTISGLTIILPNLDSDVAMFLATNGGASISNLGLINPTVVGSTFVRANAFLVGGHGLNSAATINNVYVSGGQISGSAGNVGGLVGNNFVTGTITNSYVNAVLTSTGTGWATGGLSATNAGTINNSYSTGTITNTGASKNIGGLVGLNSGASALITNSYSTVSMSNSAAGTDSNVGGLVGKNQSGATISNSYSKSPTSAATINNASRAGVGGLVAHNLSNINNSYSTSVISNTANISGGAALWVGGLVGFNQGGTITNSYTANAIANSGTATSATLYLGGLVGQNTGTLINTYSARTITNSGANVTTGGLVAASSGTITSSYWDNTLYTPASPYGAGRDTAQMMTQGTFSGWSFYDPAAPSSNPWYMAGYPHLTLENTSTITNAVELQLMNVNLSRNYTLANNIDASGTSSWNGGIGFTPIGNYGYGYAGIFDGGNHTINGLTINITIDNGGYGVGLFGAINMGSIIKNIGLTNVNIVGPNSSPVGGLVGDGSMGEATISNSYVTGAISRIVGGVGTAGGLAGVFSGDITDSYNAATINNRALGGHYTGGLVGYYVYGNLSNSYNTGAITSTGSGGYIGGLAGMLAGVSVTESYNTGTVQGGGNGLVGGLTGQTYAGASISNSYNTGEIIGTTGDQVGGIAGRNYIGSITDSYNAGYIHGVSNVGGIAGSIQNASTINRSYSSGPIAGTSNVGGLLGSIGGGGSAANVTNSYWDTQTSGQTTSAAGVGKTTFQMMQQATFSGWDFSNTWGIIEGVSYPYLKAFYATTPQVVKGTVYSNQGSTASANQKVNIVAGGSQISAFSGANGFYYGLLPANTFATDSILLAYIPNGGSVQGNTITLTNNSHITGLNIYGNTVIARSDSGSAINNTHIASAKGSLNDTGILYSATGNALSLNADKNFLTWTGTTYTVNDNITTSNGFIVFQGPANFTSNAVLSSNNGNITFAGAVSATNNTVTLNAGSGNILATASTNDFSTLAIGSGNIASITDANNIALGNISITDDLTITALAGSITRQSGTVTVGAGKIITFNAAAGSIGASGANMATGGAGAKLHLFAGNNGAFISHSGDATLLAANLAADIALYVEASGVLTLPAIAINTGAGNLTLRSGGPFVSRAALSTTSGNITLYGGTGNTINHAITSGGGSINIATATGAIDTEINSAITSTSGGNISLLAGRDLKLAANIATSDGINLTAGSGATTGAITQTAGKLSGATSLAISAASGITLNAANTITGSNLNVTNTTSGNVSITNTGTINGLVLTNMSGGGTFTLDNTGSVAITGTSAISNASPVNINALGATSDVTFNSASNFNAGTSNVAINAGRNIVFNTGNLTTSGNVSLTSGGTISETSTGKISAALLTTNSVGGTILNAANTISSFNATNATSGNIQLTNTGALNITGINQVVGNLTIANTGAITQSVGITVNGAGATATFGAGSSNNITLTNAANDFTTLAISSGNNVSVSDANALALGASTISGNLTINTSGAITQNGILTVIGTSNFSAGANAITLTQNNDFTGAVSLNNSGANNISINDANALVLGASSVGGNLVINANGAITQTDALTVGGSSNFSAGANAITLTQNNTFSGAISLNNSGANNIALKNSTATVLGTSSIGSGTLNLTVGGALTQAGAITQAGSGAITLIASNANTDINLGTQANSFLGATTFGGTLSNIRDVNIRNTNSLATVPSNVGSLTNLRNLTITFDNAAINLPAVTLNDGGNLILTSGGAITQSGVLTVPGTATFNAGAMHDINLSSFANDFNTITINGAKDTTIYDANNIDLSDISIAGNLAIHSTGGSITQNSGWITVGAAKNIILDAGAAGSIGTSSAPIHTTGAGAHLILSAHTTGAYITHAGNVILNDPTLGANTALSVTASGALSLALTAPINTGEGDLTLISGGSLTTAAALSTSSGAMTLIGSTGLFINHALTTDSGNINIQAPNSNEILLENNVTSTSGNISATAAGSILIGAGNISTAGNVDLTSGNVISENNTGLINANQLTTYSVNGTTLYRNNTVSLFNASNYTSGNIIINNIKNTLTLTGINQNGGGYATVNNTGDLIAAGNISVGSDGNLYLTALDGSLTVSSFTPVTTNSGSMFLTTTGAASDINFNSSVNSTSGDITANAGRNISLDSGNLSTSSQIILIAGGTINEIGTGAITAGHLATSSIGGTSLTQANTISGLFAENSIAGNINITNSGALDITGINQFAGNLTIDNTGAITQTGIIRIFETGAVTTLAAGNSNDITLNAANDWQTLNINSGRNVAVTDVNALDFGASTIAGTLNVNTGGEITQTGALTVAGTSSFNAGANAINLAQNNDFTGAVTLNNSGSNNVSITDVNALVLGASSIGGNLTVNTAGTITQSGALSVNGVNKTATFTAGSGNDIKLTNAANDFTTLAIGSANNVNVTDTNALVLGASTVAGSLVINTGGTITQSAAISANTLTASATSSINLSNSNNQIQNLGAITRGGAFTLVNTGDLTVNGSISAGTVTNPVLINTSGALVLSTGITITGNTTGDAITLVGQSFTNNAGANVFNIGSGRYLVWSADPANDNRGGLAYNFKQYNATYDVTTVLGTGNGFLYSTAPTITAALTGTASKTYDGTTTATLSAANYDTVTGAIDGDTVVLNNSTTGTYDNKNVGTGKAITISGLAISSANDGAATVYGYQLNSTVSNNNIGAITAKSLTIADVIANNKTYDTTTTATLNTNSAGLTGVAAGDSVTLNSASAAGSFASTNAGNAIIVNTTGFAISGTDAGNYTLAQPTLSANITPATLTITADAATKVYGNNDPTFTYSASGLQGSDTLSGALNRAITSQTDEDVGAHAITLGTLTAGSNYTISYNGADLTITPATLTITVNAQTKVYGDADPVFTYTASGLINKTVDGIAINDSISGNLGRATGEDVGNYAINIGDLNAGDNYAINFTGANLSITPAMLTVTADAKSKTYGDTDPTLTYSVTGLKRSDTSSILNGELSRATGEDVGAYAINQNDLNAGSNYTINYAGADLTITPATLSVVADAKNKVYGDSDPTLTYTVTGFKRGDTNSILEGELSRVTGEDVGAYAINQNDLNAGSNYTINYAGADLTITPATLNITADAKTKVYGGADPTLTYTATGFKRGDTSSILTVDLSRVAGENVGNYTINQNTLTANSNYNIIYNSNNLTITPAPLNLINANANNKTYDGTTTATLNLGGASLTGIIASDSGNVQINTSGYSANFASANAGLNIPITITDLLSGSAASNYTLTDPNLTANISPAELTIVVNPVSKFINTSDPALTYTVTGLLPSDSASLILGGQLERQAGEGLGSYVITQGTLTSLSNNYVITVFNNSDAIFTILDPSPVNSSAIGTSNDLFINPANIMPEDPADKNKKKLACTDSAAADCANITIDET